MPNLQENLIRKDIQLYFYNINFPEAYTPKEIKTFEKEVDKIMFFINKATTEAEQAIREDERLRVKKKWNLPELLKLEKERDEEYERASTQHKYHPSAETLIKMKSLEDPNDTYRSGIRQGKIEILTNNK